ncbi:MAG: response regulator [Gemmatimonadota bacterium]|uniref:response regulator n=1 Tax=Candidatus Palauibacter soopunensis TaxID=3056739 RepID=UPI0023A0C565|nr:response regulator [Candidatus Palauibacter soopunensis]MDE2879212.1 response regulator [Candidatus Palauibacter soopunensis]MDE2943778.1 response regulator [Gemmatimonadota bacterium]
MDEIRPDAGTVMVVDDEDMVVDAIKGFLELETDHLVLPFTSARDALTHLEEEPVHAIVADLMMPELDGVQFLTQARRMRPEATRILLTGYADKENAILAINEAGLYQYLEKPWNNDALAFAIRNGVERSLLFRALTERMAELEAANDELAGLRQRWIQAFL